MFLRGARIRKIYSPEKLIGSPANFIYDFLCLKDALKRDYDIIFECGYGSSAPSFVLKNNISAKIITNMDGLEWKRSKWSGITQKLMLGMEGYAVKKSDYLVSDNIGIYNYYLDKYKVESYIIPYGANLFDSPDFRYCKGIIPEPMKYFLVVARLEPENNIELILDGFLRSNSPRTVIVIGNHKTKYAYYLVKKYKDDHRIKFIGTLYEIRVLNNLRYFSIGYFHGHSVGGTNPSLLEAMAASAFIIAHDNEFNRSVLGNDALYFNDLTSVKSIVEKIDELSNTRDKFIFNNRSKIRETYSWERIINKYNKLFQDILNIDAVHNTQKEKEA